MSSDYYQFVLRSFQANICENLRDGSVLSRLESIYLYAEKATLPWTTNMQLYAVLLEELAQADARIGIQNRVRPFLNSQVVPPYNNSRSLTGRPFEVERFQYYCELTNNGSAQQGLIADVSKMSTYLDDLYGFFTISNPQNSTQFFGDLQKFYQYFVASG